MRFPLLSVVVAVATLPAAACASLSTELRTAEARYDEARYDEALVWLEDLEEDLPEMEPDERARFYFLRGMTAYRRGERDDALHYLALARETVEAGASLDEAPRERLEATLAELVPTEGATHHARPASREEPPPILPSAGATPAP